MSKNAIVALLFVLTALFFPLYVFSEETSLGADVLCQQGRQYYDQGLSRLAAEYFRRCLEQDPANQEAKKYLGMIGQAYIAAVQENARERYETSRDVYDSKEAPAPSSNESQPTYTAPSYAQAPARNLDYQTAQSSPAAVYQAPPVSSQVTQQAGQEAQRDFSHQYNIQEEAISAARQDYTKEKQRQADERHREARRERKEIINKALEEANFKMDVEYQFAFGEQSFRIISPLDGSPLSKLTFPIRGGMGIANMEAKILPRLFVGGRFGHSNFDRTTSKDEDWNIFIMGDYTYTEQETKNCATLWDANIYYRMFDWDRQELDNYIKEMFLVDRLYIDIFGGYQYFKGRTTMIDPITHEYYEILGIPLIDDTTEQNVGLNSEYEVIHKGPRAGLRVGGDLTEKLSSSLSFAYAWLETESAGSWNLRNFNWTHKGDDGFGFNVDAEALYHITPNWYLGGGFHYLYAIQEKLLYSGTQPAGDFTDLDLARDEKVTAYGPSLKMGYRF